jgi:hypothetical protein
MCSRRIDLRLVTYSQEKSAKGPLLAYRIPGCPSITGLGYKISPSRTLPYTWNPLLPVTNGTIRSA